MTNTLLISPQQDLIEAIQVALPLPNITLQADTLKQARSYIRNHTSQEPFILDLIFIEDENDIALMASCRQLSEDYLLINVPVIAVLSDSESRQAVLEAGANDYLLRPLVISEIRVRASCYLRSSLQVFQVLGQVLEYMEYGSVPSDIWKQDLQNLAELFNAEGAWLFLQNQPNHTLSFTGGFNPPQKINQLRHRLLDFINQQTDQDFQQLPLVDPYLKWPEYLESSRFRYHQLIFVHNNRRLFGVLTLAYHHPYRLTLREKQVLRMVGHTLGTLLIMQQIQQETQAYATQNAFMVLMARTINKQFELSKILSLALEQAVPILNASTGDIWLVMSNDETKLTLNASVRHSLAGPEVTELTIGQGLIGWVAVQGVILQTTTPLEDDRFDPMVDSLDSNTSVLIAPLRHHESVIGVFAVYNRDGYQFNNHDVVLLEGIAGLTASVIANARLLQELREHASQRRVLYEMSQQIAAGLDLEPTIDRILYWIGRLLNIETGTLWLLDEGSNRLNLVATQGLEMHGKSFYLDVGEGLVGWVAKYCESITLNNAPDQDPRFNDQLIDQLNLKISNITVSPLIYSGRVIGVLALINKTDGNFEEADLTLLSTALEMVAVVLGNARLHTQTVQLMEERERLHQQVIQSERLATVGRLTASLSHEINNPMQAIQGALTLALEEMDSPEDLAIYLELCITESERVVKLLNRLRQVYRPQADMIESLDINSLILDAIALSEKELSRHNVQLVANLADNLPRIAAVANQLHLVFLSIILNFSDAVGSAGGGTLTVDSQVKRQTIKVRFSTAIASVPVSDWEAALASDMSEKVADVSFGLSLSHDFVKAHGGTIQLRQEENRVIYIINLPTDQARA